MGKGEQGQAIVEGKDRAKWIAEEGIKIGRRWQSMWMFECRAA